MLFTTEWLATYFPNTNNTKASIHIEHVVTDSRISTTSSLFIPIVGDHFDGHQFVEEAIQNGAVAIFWQQDHTLPKDFSDDFPVFFVEDTLLALQQLAATYREKVNPIVVGVTGSNGKTTTKDIVAAIVNTTYKTHATDGNLNNHIGLPLTVLSMAQDTEVLILEMGMNHFGEISLLSKIAKPDLAIITNIGESHIEFLGTREGIAKAKLEIVAGLNEKGTLLIDGDEPLLASYDVFPKIVSCGFNERNEVFVSDVNVFQDRTTFKLNGNEQYEIPLLGKHHAKNTTLAITAGKLLKVADEDIKRGLASLKISGMRFELLEGKNQSFIINDAYNASPTSMKASIDVLKQMTGFQEKILVLGDILELGDYSKAMHEKVAEEIDESITAVLTYGDEAKYITLAVDEFSPQTISEHYQSKTALLTRLETFLKPHTLILFKASRGMEFENLVQSVVK